MTYIDTHTHIYGEEFDADRAEVIARAREAGAEALLLPATDLQSTQKIMALCQDYAGYCYPMIGLHPEDIPADPEPELTAMEQLLETQVAPFVAVGEVGIDLYWDASRRDEQVEVFRRQIGWAVRYDLPLVIHSRKAHRLLCDTLRPAAKELRRGGVFHCFSGSAEEARELLRFEGFYLGIGGVLTFKNCKLPATLAAGVPLERLVVETDAPYLTPVPYRGQRNEPAYVPYVIARLAEVYETTPEEVGRVTTENARRLFGI